MAFAKNSTTNQIAAMMAVIATLFCWQISFVHLATPIITMLMSQTEDVTQSLTTLIVVLTEDHVRLTFVQLAWRSQWSSRSMMVCVILLWGTCLIVAMIEMIARTKLGTLQLPVQPARLALRTSFMEQGSAIHSWTILNVALTLVIAKLAWHPSAVIVTIQ